MSEIADLSIAGAADGLDAGDFSAVELTEACLARIDALDGRLNAFVRVLPDEARAAAAASDARRARGAEAGPLDGVPVALKDNIDIEGVPTTAGFGFRRDAVADADAHVTARLRAAGAVILGKTNMHEGALGATTDNVHFGRTYNPYGQGRTPGGSSGGSGAAVAARLCPGALGTDTMGSVRIPASYCGIVGLIATHGAISTRGVFPLSWRLDHVGPMTRTVEDAALMLAVLEDFDPASPESRRRPTPRAGEPAVKGLRLGVVAELDRTPWEPAVRGAFTAALDTLRAAGCEIETVSAPGYEPTRARTAGFMIVEAEAAYLLAEVFAADPSRFSGEVQGLLAYGTRMDAGRMVRCERTVAEAGFAARQALAGVDALVAPTTPQPGFPFGDPVPPTQGDLTALANLADCPSISLPMGLDEAGMPLGLQFVAPAWHEDTVIALARAYEAARGAVAPPALAA